MRGLFLVSSVFILASITHARHARRVTEDGKFFLPEYFNLGSFHDTVADFFSMKSEKLNCMKTLKAMGIEGVMGFAKWSQNRGNFIKVPPYTTYYFDDSAKLTFGEAHEFCRKRGMKLLEIESKGEFETVIALLGDRNVHHGSYVWLGLSDEDSEGEYRYPDDLTEGKTSPAYTNWDRANHEPNNFPAGADCVQFRYEHSPSEALWRDYACSAEALFMCELKNYCLDYFSSSDNHISITSESLDSSISDSGSSD